MDPATPEIDKALVDFQRAAIEWAATGYGKPLVEAAVEALMAGLDTPSLVLLAGAAKRFADEEAAQYGPEAFEELGLEVPQKHSDDAYVKLAKLEALRFLEGQGTPGQLAADLYMLLAKSGYREELAGFSNLDDWYSLHNAGYVPGPGAAIDKAVGAPRELWFQSCETSGPRLRRQVVARSLVSASADAFRTPYVFDRTLFVAEVRPRTHLVYLHRRSMPRVRQAV